MRKGRSPRPERGIIDYAETQILKNAEKPG
ncbi:MAG: hypothetical protein BWY28_02257 [bacterium ADurb.Bin236]|nr:MAG: hypothetical protein BWY28_02257 [bacterium ADurb.Bin236]